MRRGSRFAALALALAAGAGPLVAQAQTRVSATYEGRLVIKLLDVRHDAALTPAGYRAGARISTGGLAGAVKPFALMVRSEGRRRGAALASERYRQQQGSKTRLVVFPAPRAPGAVDPLTQLLRLQLRPQAAGPCAGRLAIYDGRQRYDLVFARAGSGAAEPRFAALGLADGRSCRVTFIPLSGFGGEKGRPPRPKSDIVARYAWSGAAQGWVLTGLAAGTPLGKAELTLHDLQVVRAAR